MAADSFTLTMISLEIIVAIVVIFGNGLVCYAILNSRKLRKKIMYMFVTSLSVADLSVGVFAIPFFLLTKFGLPRNAPTLCVIVLSFVMIPTMVSVFTLMTISIERYIAIRHPTIHRNKLTFNKALIAIIITWVVCTVIGLVPLMGWRKMPDTNLGPSGPLTELEEHNTTTTYTQDTMDNESSGASAYAVHYAKVNSKDIVDEFENVYCIFLQVMDIDYMLFLFIAFLLPSLFTSAVLYFIVFLRVVQANKTTIGKAAQNKKQSNGTVRKSDKSSSSDIGCSTEVPSEKKESQSQVSSPQTDVSKPRHQDERQRKRAKETRAATVLGVIVILFATCWLPINTLNAIVRFAPSTRIPVVVFDIATLLGHINSAVNFFLYSWRLKAFREELQMIFNRFKISNN